MEKPMITMSRKEARFGIIYIFMMLIVLPIILIAVNELIPNPLNEAQLNFALFAINFLCVTVACRDFLLTSLRDLFADIGSHLKAIGLGFLLYWILTIAVNILVMTLDPDFTNVNDDSIDMIAQSNFTLMTIGTVVLVPVVEETLFRGAIFGRIATKHPVLAYIISITAFSSIHVIGYIGLFPPMRLLLCLIQYVPAAFVLARTYQKSGNILPPVLIHMIVNLIGMMAMK